MLRLAITLALISAPAFAGPPSELVAKELDSEAIEIADQGGAIDRSADITMTLELAANGKAKLVSVGKRGEHNLYSNFSTDDDTTWKTSWAGTWTGDATSMTLSLGVASTGCKSTHTTNGGSPEIRTCSAPAKTTQLACATVQISVDTGGAKPVAAEAWECSASDSLGEPGHHWTFGKTRCVQARGREGLGAARNGPVYAVCP